MAALLEAQPGQEPSRAQTWARRLAQQHRKSRKASLFALGRLDRCDSEETVAKFWLLARPTEPAAGVVSTAQPLAALQGHSWKGRHRQGTWGHHSLSEKQSPPFLHLSYPGKVIYLGSFSDTSRLKYVRALLTWMHLEEETPSPASARHTHQLCVSKHTQRPSLCSQLIFSPAHTQIPHDPKAAVKAVTLEPDATGGRARWTLSDGLKVPK